MVKGVTNSTMRIGFLPSLNPSGGGIYQYSLAMLEILHTLQEERSVQDEFVVFNRGGNITALSQLNQAGWKTVPLKLPLTFHQQILHTLGHILGKGKTRQMAAKLYRRLVSKNKFSDPNKIIPRPDLARLFIEQRIDWVLYPISTTISFETGIPYVMAVHDLQHRLHPEFPEVSANGIWEWREYLFRNGTRYAMLVLVDSQTGKEDVLEFYGSYGVTPDKIKVLPFLPPPYLSISVSEEEKQRIRKFYNLPDRYLFYPAKFWPHKNHLRIVEALGIIKERHGLEIPIVFVGSYKGEIRENNFHDVISLARQFNIINQIHYFGHIPDEHMSTFYAEATALVFPTFFGPTNIPPLEAWTFGCPVLTSNIRGIREQMGSAALLVDPASSESIADGIYQLWTDENLRKTLGEKGKKRLSTYTSVDFRRRLIKILKEAKERFREKKVN